MTDNFDFEQTQSTDAEFARLKQQIKEEVRQTVRAAMADVKNARHTAVDHRDAQLPRRRHQFTEIRTHLRCASGQIERFDMFFFEVATKSGIKMLHEMRPGEMGSMIVSTPILPRYRIGDLILAFKPPYFRYIGRDGWLTPLRYAWDELMTFNLGQL